MDAPNPLMDSILEGLLCTWRWGREAECAGAVAVQGRERRMTTKSRGCGDVRGGRGLARAAQFLGWLGLKLARRRSDGRSHARVQLESPLAPWKKTIVLGRGQEDITRHPCIPLFANDPSKHFLDMIFLIFPSSCPRLPQCQSRRALTTFTAPANPPPTPPQYASKHCRSHSTPASPHTHKTAPRSPNQTISAPAHTP